MLQTQIKSEEAKWDQPGPSGIEAAKDKPPAGNRPDVDNPDGESSEEEMENGENESIELCQKMKQPAVYNMYMGPIDIRAAGCKFTLVNPANGGKVCSDRDWDAADRRSESTNLLTFEDFVRMSLSSCYWEWIISSSTTFNESESIFRDDFSKIGYLFFKEETNKDEIEGFRNYYEMFDRSFDSIMEIIKQMCSQAATNCDLCILSLNIKGQVRPGSQLNRMLRLIFSSLNATEYLHPKWKTGINIPIQTKAGVLYAMNFRTFPWYPDANAMVTLVDDKNDLFFTTKYKPMMCDTLQEDLPHILIVHQTHERVQ